MIKTLHTVVPDILSDGISLGAPRIKHLENGFLTAT